MCKYCGATQIEEVNGRVICSYCKSPQLDIEPTSKPKGDGKLNKLISSAIKNELNYRYLFSGCVELKTVPLLTITPSIINP